jgi:non-ribosomal peptide synthetase component E (peptide arylation enzyme)
MMQNVRHPRSRTLPDLLDEIAGRDPAHEFIAGGSQRLSCTETRARARQLAKGLRRLGGRRGDKVTGTGKVQKVRLAEERNAAGA